LKRSIQVERRLARETRLLEHPGEVGGGSRVGTARALGVAYEIDSDVSEGIQRKNIEEASEPAVVHLDPSVLIAPHEDLGEREPVEEGPGAYDRHDIVERNAHGLPS
jgi:hypothetical protein